MITAYSCQLIIVGLYALTNRLFIYLVLKVFEVDPFLWLMVTGTREEHLPLAHKHQLTSLFYHRDHHRNNLNKHGKKPTFPLKLNYPQLIIFIKEARYLILCYNMSGISAWFLCIAKLLSETLTSYNGILNVLFNGIRKDEC